MNGNGKLKVTEKVGYGLGELAGTANSLFGAFLTMFYTDNMAMAAGAVGTLFLISKVFDGITDLLAGSIVDHTKTRWGKARPWLLWMSVPAGLSIILIFMMPATLSETGKLVYAFLTYNLFSSVIYTMIGVAKGAMMPLMTQDGIERGQLAMVSILFGLGGTVLAMSATFPFINAMGGGADGWRKVFMVYGVIVTIGLLASFFMTKEHVQAVESVQTGKQETISFGEGFKLFIKNRYFVFALGMTILLNLSTNLNSSSQTYFYKYTMEDEMLTSSLNLLNLVPLFFSLLVLSGLCLRKFGKKKSVYIGAGGQIIGYIFRGAAGLTGNVVLLAIGTVISAAATGPLSVPVNVLTADAVDYGEYKFGKRIEGTGSAVVSFSQKIAVGLSAAAVGWMLEFSGFVANEVQTASTNAGITFVFAWCPAICLTLLILLYLFFYHYDEEEPKVIAELNRRKEAAKA